jgi:NitT/TauT family transport system ATP-binding protein
METGNAIRYGTRDASVQRLVEVQDLGVTYGAGATAVEAIGDLSFEVGEGEFVCIVGPSGCGKTTLLKALAGLLRPTRGRAVVAGDTVTGPRGDLALVFQDYTRSLMPWMSVRKNVVFPLAAKRVPKAEQAERAAEALREVGLTGFEDRYPWQLSGGMQQRVAIARALAYRPDLLLMDEPFASVDAQTRFELEDMILKIRDEFGVTIVLVTHDIDEAVYLADRIVVLSRAPSVVERIVDVGLARPRSQSETRHDGKFVALRTEILQMVTGG